MLRVSEASSITVPDKDTILNIRVRKAKRKPKGFSFALLAEIIEPRREPLPKKERVTLFTLLFFVTSTLYVIYVITSNV